MWNPSCECSRAGCGCLLNPIAPCRHVGPRYNAPRLWDPRRHLGGSMAPKIKIAAVGCGGMGRRHLRGMVALYGSSRCNLELVAACDLKPEQLQLYADEAEQLLGTRPRVFTDIAEMARAIPNLEAADVTVESGFHHSVAIACMEAGLHVMVEKPMAVTIRGCDLMIQAASKTGK